MYRPTSSFEKLPNFGKILAGKNSTWYGFITFEPYNTVVKSMTKDDLVSLNETATLLGINLATIRNWDKKGKLKAYRNPTNNYRMFRLSEVLALQKKTSLFHDEAENVIAERAMLSQEEGLTPSKARRLINVLHRTLRDMVGNSNLLLRFDEISKLIYCKASLDKESDKRLLDSHSSGQVLRSFYHELVSFHPDWFPPPFNDFQVSDDVLTRLAQVVAPVNLTPTGSDIKGFAYEEVIRNTFEKGDNQQFFTPPQIIQFMVDFLEDSLRGTICDPACGTGGFLIASAQRLSKRTSRKRQLAHLLGLEIDERLAWAARINLQLHDAISFDVRHLIGSGALSAEPFPELNSIDVILTNPPFGSDLSEQKALHSFKLGKNRQSRRRGVLFIERCLALLKPGGLVGIIIDDGVLNGPSNADTRHLILSQSDLVAVVGLPETAFMPYASVRASILFLQKHGGRQRRLLNAKGTFFARADEVGRKPNGDALLRVDPTTRHLLLASDLPQILNAWMENKDSTQGHRFFWTQIPSIDDSEYSNDKWRLDSAFHHPSRQISYDALRKSPYPTMTISELCDIRNDTFIPSTDFEDDDITYVGLANIEPRTGILEPKVVLGRTLKSTVKRFESGDILYAKMRPELRKVSLVQDNVSEGFASAECVVLIPRKSPSGHWLFEPELMAELLRSDIVYGQIVHRIIGIGRPRLSKTTVLTIKLPVPPPTIQRQLIRLLQRSRQTVNELIRESEEAKKRAEQCSLQAQEQLAEDLLGAEAFTNGTTTD